MRIRSLALLILLAVVSLFFVACDSNSSAKEYSFERSVQEPVIEKRCIEGGAKSDCYLLKWRIPVDTKKLKQVHVWIDTMVIDSNDESVSDKAKGLSIKRPFIKSSSVYDSLDISEALEAYKDRDDTIQIALWAEYEDDGTPSRIVRTFVILGDDIDPARVQTTEEVTHKSVLIRWTRPMDQVDFYHPDSLKGPIYGYNVFFRNTADLKLDTAKVTLTLAGKDVSSALLAQKQFQFFADSFSLSDAKDGLGERHFAIRDSLGYAGDSTDEYEFLITGVLPETKYVITIEAYDIAGNVSISEEKTVMTTDSITPLAPPRFWLQLDTLDDGKVALDSNRVYLYWLRTVDPLIKNSNIKVGDSLEIPKNCAEGTCYRQVKAYFVETFDGLKWNSLRVATGEEHVLMRWKLKNDVMSIDPAGRYVSDTIRWISPGDTLRVRMRVQDSSGAYSEWLEDTLLISRGALSSMNCPAGYKAVKKRSGADTTKYAAFCMEKWEHRDSKGNFLSNVLYEDARKLCQADASLNKGFSFDLCLDQDWFSACVARNSSYGTIQEYPFDPQEFLLQECNQATGESSPVFDITLRNSKCSSPDGIRDLPGQLQEWTRSALLRLDTLKTGKVDTLYDSVGVLKGSSYVSFTTADRTVLARCGAVATPTRMRPRYTKDSVYLYQNGTKLDTLAQRDTTRKLYSALGQKSYHDVIRLYEVLHPESKTVLAEDYVSQEEFDRRGGERYLETIANGLEYRFLRLDTVLLLRGLIASPDSRKFYRESSVGFRCCAVPNP